MNPQSPIHKIFLLWGSLAWNIFWSCLVFIAAIFAAEKFQKDGLTMVLPFAVSGWIGSLFPLIWVGIFHRKTRIPFWHYLPVIILLLFLCWEAYASLFMIAWACSPNTETF